MSENSTIGSRATLLGTSEVPQAISAETNIARKILFIVPLYKNAHLIPALFKSIAAAEFSAFDSRVLFINDSPNDIDLTTALEAHISQLPESCHAVLLLNEANSGFIKSCNKGLKIALAEGRDAILFNSDALLTPGALKEMAEVAYSDALIGFVSPRSNNATICTSPYPNRYRNLDFDSAIKAHRHIERLLPRVTYAPTAVGFCLYIRHLMLVEFGLLDEVYGRGYNEENDFIMRCNRCGYRAVLANHAFVYHIGQASFSLTEMAFNARDQKNYKILLRRFPEYARAVRRYFDGPEYRSQWLLAGLIPDERGRLRILFDCCNFGCFHNGTYEFGRKVIAAFSRRFADKYACFISCGPEALKFHGFDSVAGLSYIGAQKEARRSAPYAAVIRLSQPFATADLTSWARLAPLVGFVMLDTIAMDCQNLDEVDLDLLWNQMLQVASLIGYNSRFSRDQFRRRFAIPGEIVEFRAFHSIDPTDYLPASKTPDTSLEENSYVLIVGNHFAHKNIAETLAQFHEIESPPPLVVLGVKTKDDLVRASYEAGELAESLVDNLYAHAAVVLFPSHYEGFGFPILHALKYRKPVIARDLPSAQEIKQQAPHSANIHLFQATREMVRLACTSLEWAEEPASVDVKPLHNWVRCALGLDEGLRNAIEKLQLSSVRRRLAYTNRLDEELGFKEQSETKRWGPLSICKHSRLGRLLFRD